MFPGKFPLLLNCIVIHRGFVGVGQNCVWFLWALLPLLFSQMQVWRVHRFMLTSTPAGVLFCSLLKHRRVAGVAVTKIHLNMPGIDQYLKIMCSRKLWWKSKGKMLLLRRKGFNYWTHGTDLFAGLWWRAQQLLLNTWMTEEHIFSIMFQFRHNFSWKYSPLCLVHFYPIFFLNN